MRLLLGSIYVNDSKAYALPKFQEMHRSILSDIDCIFVSDSLYDIGFHTIPYEGPQPAMWATEICNHAKRQLGKYALENGYDGLIWQGVDCYYTCRADFDALVEVAEKGADIVGAVIAGRTDEYYPVCRSFAWTRGEDGFMTMTTEERENTPEFFHRQTPVANVGYIGSDATIISRRALELVDMSGYEEWWTRRDVPGTLGPDEWFMYRAIKDHSIIPVAHRGVRPWHCHEDLVAKRFPGQTTHLETISWQ